MAKVSKDVLKSFFQTGRKPSAANFASLIESLMHEDERSSLGLKNYNSARTYTPGDTAIYSGDLYQATHQTTGTFAPGSWNNITASGDSPTPVDTPVFGSDYGLVETREESAVYETEFVAKVGLETEERQGRYRVQWWAVIGLDGENIGNFRFMNVSEDVMLGSMLTYQSMSHMQKISIGGVEIIDFNWRYTYVNDALTKYSQFAKNEMIGRSIMEVYAGVAVWSEESCRIYNLDAKDNKQTLDFWASFLHPDDRDHVMEIIREQNKTLRDMPFDYWIVLRNGEIKYIHSESKFEYDANGKPVSLYGITHDITERKLAEENQRRGELRLKEAQALSHTSNWEIDMATGLHTWSDELYAIFGIAKGAEQASAGLFLSFMHAEDLQYAAEKVQEAFDTLKASSFHFRYVRRDGEMRYGYTEWKVDFDRSDRPLRIYGILQDVTRQKLAEKEREKMMADLLQHSKNLEQFAYVVSHNLRSPVAHILGLSNILKGDLSDADRALSHQFMHNAVEQLDTIVMDLNKILEVRAAIAENKEEVDLNEVVEGIQISIHDSIEKENVRIEKQFEVHKLNSIPSYIYSIFFNLITNSIKYRQPGKAPEIRIRNWEEDGKLNISFKDNGTGMDLEQYGDKVFGLYHRFHSHISGKGVGLFMVRTQAEALEGKVTVRSNPGEGTEFIVELPMT